MNEFLNKLDQGETLPIVIIMVGFYAFFISALLFSFLLENKQLRKIINKKNL